MAKTKSRDIFDELDAKTAARNACTCGTMMAFLIILLILSIIGSFYTIKLVSERVNGDRISFSDVSGKDVIAKLQSFVAKPPQQQEVELVITDKELTALLQEAAAQNEALPIKGLQAAITPEAIVIGGTVQKPLTSDISIWLVPKVLAGQLDFDIVKVTAGRLTLPKIAVDFLSGKIVDFLKANLAQLRNIPASEVELNSGSMTIK